MTEHRRDPSADAMAHAADPARPADHGDATVAHDVADDGHHDEHGADEHGADEHGADALGPIDTVGWAVGLIGVLLGLAVALCFVFATGGIG